ncbi:MAG: NADH-quinone oxidoreductase subunit C [Chloroflexi bacterium]|nr:MAG: NADH-quinone oxidoreductase subunit C [Chloroflexota bacterium]
MPQGPRSRGRSQDARRSASSTTRSSSTSTVRTSSRWRVSSATIPRPAATFTHDPHVPSLAGVWEGANWPERETYDMFGIEFDGHPDLRRIFLEESFPGHPLRKSFLPPRSDARGG